MTEEQISVKDFAENNGLLRQTVFKILKRLQIDPAKSRGGAQNRGQTISYITQQDADRVLASTCINQETRRIGVSRCIPV